MSPLPQIMAFAASLLGIPAGLLIGRACNFEKEEIETFASISARTMFILLFLTLSFFILRNVFLEVLTASIILALAFFLDSSQRSLIISILLSGAAVLVFFLNSGILTPDQIFAICAALFCFWTLAASLLPIKFGILVKKGKRT